MRVGQNFVPGGGIERSAFRVLDAWVEIESGFLGAAGVFDAVFAGKRIDVFVVEIEIAGNLAELLRLRNSAKGIFGSNLRKLQRGIDHAIEAVAGKITGVGAGCALAAKHAHANGARSGFFESFDLAQADQCGEFVAFADYAFGGGGAAVHGAADDVLGKILQIGCYFVFEFQLVIINFSASEISVRGQRDTRTTRNPSTALGIDKSLALSLHEPAGIFSRRSSNGEAINFDRWNADADRYGLTIFAAGAYAFVELQIVADH